MWGVKILDEEKQSERQLLFSALIALIAASLSSGAGWVR
jgi:hypothetical protein